MTELPEPLVLPDAAAWRAWLDEHESTTNEGAWVLLAKKGTTEPTSLSFDEALDEALCSGWVDSQLRRHDDATYLQRFAPRRPRSVWSVRSAGLVERLMDEGRMRARGRAVADRARADGRWPIA